MLLRTRAVPAQDRTRSRFVSPLTRRILTVNLIAPVVLAFGLLYLDQYQSKLVVTEMSLLSNRARLYATALSQSIVADNPAVDVVTQPRDEAEVSLEADSAAGLIKRLVGREAPRVRIFDTAGVLIVDSRRLIGPSGQIEIEPLPDPEPTGGLRGLAFRIYDWIAPMLPLASDLERYEEPEAQSAASYAEVGDALRGDIGRQIRSTADGGIMLSVAVPIQPYKRVIGGLLLSADGSNIQAAVRAVRLEILAIFAGCLVLTILLSIYLAVTIIRPLRMLAGAAELLRRGNRPAVEIPDLRPRNDEIGDLSIALREMTTALNSRIEGTERFAADVAHELKNPLTSLRSAIETAIRVDDPAKRQRLFEIVLDDIGRLNRLITEISDASRVDAELARTTRQPVDLARMVDTMVEVDKVTAESAPDRARLRRVGAPGSFWVVGAEERLEQVFSNLVGNARSFSPPGGTIRLRLERDGAYVLAAVEDDGPGIPPGREEAVFERFYSERPAGEKFGSHSGLGLSICRQVIDAHRGMIEARNREGRTGVEGASFTVRLPSLAAWSGDEPL